MSAPRFHTYDNAVGEATVGGVAAAGDHTPGTAVNTLPTATAPPPKIVIVGVGVTLNGDKLTGDAREVYPARTAVTTTVTFLP